MGDGSHRSEREELKKGRKEKRRKCRLESQFLWGGKLRKGGDW